MQTSHQHVHIYAIYSWKEPMAPGSSPLLTRDVPRVDVYLRGSVQVSGVSFMPGGIWNLRPESLYSHLCRLILTAPGRQRQRDGRR